MLNSKAMKKETRNKKVAIHNLCKFWKYFSVRR